MEARGDQGPFRLFDGYIATLKEQIGKTKNIHGGIR